MVFWESFFSLYSVWVKNAKINVFEEKWFLSEILYQIKMQAVMNWSSHLKILRT